MSRRTSAGPAQAKVYVEFCMQTSPQPSPTESNFPCRTRSRSMMQLALLMPRLEANLDLPPEWIIWALMHPCVVARSTGSCSACTNWMPSWTGWGFGRRESVHLVSLRTHESSATGRAVSSSASIKSSWSTMAVTKNQIWMSMLIWRPCRAIRSVGCITWCKRKLRTDASDGLALGTSNDPEARAIASIPARSRRISAALDRIRGQRMARNDGWESSDDEDVETRRCPNMQRKATGFARPSLPSSTPVKIASSDNALRRSKSMAALRTPNVKAVEHRHHL